MSLLNKDNMVIPKTSVKNLEMLVNYEFDDRYVCDRKGNVYLIREIGKYNLKVKRMKPFLTRDGYLEYVLTDTAGIKKHIQGHRLVALLYIKQPHPSKKYVNHKNGIRSDNRVENLEWATASENTRHSFKVLGKVVWNKKV